MLSLKNLSLANYECFCLLLSVLWISVMRDVSKKGFSLQYKGFRPYLFFTPSLGVSLKNIFRTLFSVIVVKYVSPHIQKKIIEYLVKKNQVNRLTNIAMFHTGRSGSTLLGDMLDQHSDFLWAGEIFNRLRNLSRNQVEMIIVLSMYLNERKIYGFETKTLADQQLGPECINMSCKDYIEFLSLLGFDHFIVVTRKNLLRKLVSRMVARKINKYHRTSENSVAVKVNIDLTDGRKSLIDEFSKNEMHYRGLMNALDGRKVLQLCYEEDLLDDPMVAYRKVCEFTGLEECVPAMRFQRTNPFKLMDIIDNFEETEEVLEGTVYEWMISD